MPRSGPSSGIRANQIRRVGRFVKLLALLSLVSAALAVILAAGGDGGMHARMMIATALAFGVAVFLGAGLMGIVILSTSLGRGGAERAQQEGGVE